MKKQILKDLLKGVGRYKLKGDDLPLISGIVIDSRKVKSGFLFAALAGQESDGHNFINKAIALGAVAIVCESWPETIEENVSYVMVPDCRLAIGQIANVFFDHPSSKLKCVGVTGTNGKTSVATLLYGLFKELGFRVGLISTIEILVNEKKCDTSLTTPDVVHLHGLLSEMVHEECTHVFMEVSSHAADQKRIAGIVFTGGVFTNITHDHLDYHGDFASYIRAKQSFFSSLDKGAFALTNIDDRNGEVMTQNTKATIYKYSLRRLTDYKARVLSEESLGMYLEINGFKFMTILTGKFNAANLTAVYGVARIMEDINEEVLIEKLSGLSTAKGRMEVVAYEPRVIVDYAHTPDALVNVLDTLKHSMTKGRLITVVGCGGDRDKTKRPLMGAIAVEKSDVVIFTSDNPRSEDPVEIIEEMKKNLIAAHDSQWLDIVDRRSAIKTSLTIANKIDTILIAGKGHEEYQEIEGIRHFFSDQQIVKDFLSEDI